jgi:hypothetical protein
MGEKGWCRKTGTTDTTGGKDNLINKWPPEDVNTLCSLLNDNMLLCVNQFANRTWRVLEIVCT